MSLITLGRAIGAERPPLVNMTSGHPSILRRGFRTSFIGGDTRPTTVVTRGPSRSWPTTLKPRCAVQADPHQVCRTAPARRGAHHRDSGRARGQNALCTRSTTAISRRCGSPPGMPLGDLGFGAADNARGTNAPELSAEVWHNLAQLRLPVDPLHTAAAPRRTRQCLRGESTSQAEYAGSIPVIGSTKHHVSVVSAQLAWSRVRFLTAV
jgi:hypothetical protein